MPIFNKLLHSSIRNKLSKKISDDLKKNQLMLKIQNIQIIYLYNITHLIKLIIYVL